MNINILMKYLPFNGNTILLRNERFLDTLVSERKPVSEAVNLRLKDSGKGSVIAAIQFGLGYSPELSGQYEHSQGSSAMISIIPPVPELDKERYMDDRTFALSVNNLVKIDSVRENTLNANVTYYNDYQNISTPQK